MKRLSFGVVLLIALAAASCGGDETSTTRESAGRSTGSYTGHLKEIYDQQRSVCKTESKLNTVEYREQNGATDPQGYAEYAARHGFYEPRDQAELNAAIEGCLAGLP